jgi:hypothetical protein
VAADRQRYLTIAIAVGLSLVLGWNVYRAEVESRPSEFKIGTVQEGSTTPAGTVTSIWSMPGQQPGTSTTP